MAKPNNNPMNEKKRGFTLLELIVVLTIISIAGFLIVANYRQSEKNYEVAHAAQKLASDIRDAQNKAVTGLSSDNIAVGFGIYIFSNKTYYLFYNPTSTPAVYQFQSSPSLSVVTKTIQLPSTVTFNAASVNKSIFFKPPAPTTYIDGSSAAPPLIIDLAGSATTKSVRTTVYGLVEVQ